MKTYFSKIQCPDCGTGHDPKETVCKGCKREFPREDGGLFAGHLPISWIREMLFFLILGPLGLRLLALVVQLIFGMVITAQGLATNAEELQSVMMSAPWLGPTEYTIYGIAFVGAALLFIGKFPDLFKSFKGWKPYVFGLAGFAIIIGIEFFYNLIIGIILRSVGIGNGANANQSTLYVLIDFNPFLAILFFGLIGPFVEECAYRVGLYGLSSRLGKVLGFTITAIIFGLIHFDFGGAFNFSRDGYAAAIREWTNLPIYMFSGFAFAYLYDRWGFACSYTSHALNNVFAIGQYLIMKNIGGTPNV